MIPVGGSSMPRPGSLRFGKDVFLFRRLGKGLGVGGGSGFRQCLKVFCFG